MRALLYGLGSVMIMLSALVLSLLPWLSPSLWVFLLGGPLLSLLIAAGWVLVSATAGSWPRLHKGPLVVAGGALGLLVCLWQGHWLGVAWSGMVAASGLGMTFALRRSILAGDDPAAATARPPGGR